MKLPVRRYGIGPSIDPEGKPVYVLMEVDDAGQVKALCACNPDREVLVRAIAHLNGIFDPHIEWAERPAAGTPGASIVSLFPPPKSVS